MDDINETEKECPFWIFNGTRARFTSKGCRGKISMEINDKCVGCGNCHAVCPMAAARAAVVFFMITGTSVLGAESMYSDGRPEAVKRAL